MGWYKIIWYCSKWVVDSRIWPIYFDVWISKVTLFLTWVNIMSTLHQNEDPNRGAPSSLNESRPSSHQNLFSWSTNRTTSMGSQKIRITILCARSLVKRDLFRLPDPFVKVGWIFDHDEQGLLLQKVIFCTTVQIQLQFCGIINLMHWDWKQTQSNMWIHE